MKIIRFIYNLSPVWGILEGDYVEILKESPFKRIEPSNEEIPLKGLKLLPPSTPTKIILAGLNYRDHAKELGMAIPKEPIIFLKPPSALIGDKDDIIYPPEVKRLDYEAELAFVVKREGKNIPENKAGEYILGFMCLNDVTARDLQITDGQWTRAKSFDTFCPAGPYLETDIDPAKLSIRSYLNGKIRQDSNTSNFIFPVNRLLSFISSVMTVLPGDIISTGTPKGVGQMKKSDIIEIEIEGLGKLKNKVV